MPLLGTEFFDFFGLHMIYLIIGLIIIRLIKIPLLHFIPFYVALATINIIVKQLYYPNEFLFQSVIVSAIALAILILVTGFAGSKVSAANYQSLVTALGFFPWLHSWELSITYILLAFFFLIGHSFIRQMLAFKKLDYRYMPLKDAERKMTAEEFTIFKSKASVIYAIPFLLAAIVSAALFATV